VCVRGPLTYWFYFKKLHLKETMQGVNQDLDPKEFRDNTTKKSKTWKTSNSQLISRNTIRAFKRFFLSQYNAKY
jgi:hypothetical protein